jgi:anti-anti-sigma factor
VVRAEGDTDMATIGAFEHVLSGHSSASVREVWVDLTRVRFMDSHGLHALQDMHHALAVTRRRVVVICPPGPVRRILRLTGLDDVLTVVADRTSAQQA